MKQLKSKLNAFLFSILIIALFSNCASNKSLKNPYVSYYKGENTLIYYIKPKELICKSNKSNLSVDFTFTDKFLPDTVVVNFSINKTKSFVKPTFTLQTGELKSDLKLLEIIYRESTSDDLKTRYSCYIKKQDLLNLIRSTDFQIIVNQRDIKYVFELPKKQKEKIRIIKTELLEILTEKFEIK